MLQNKLLFFLNQDSCSLFSRGCLGFGEHFPRLQNCGVLNSVSDQVSILYRDKKLQVWFLIHQVSKSLYFHVILYVCVCVCCASVHAIAYVWRSEASHLVWVIVYVDWLDCRSLGLFLSLLPMSPYWNARTGDLCHHIFICVWPSDLLSISPAYVLFCLSNAITIFACQNGDKDKVRGK